MTNDDVPARAGRVAVVSAALLALTTACSAGTHGSAGPAPSTPPPASGMNAGTPGRVTVDESGAALRITGAVAHLNASGSGYLSMTVLNSSGVPEHLDMVATPDEGRAALVGGRGVNGSLTSAGILIQSGTPTTFGPRGPEVLLSGVRGITRAGTLPLFLQFGVAGLVRLQARVAHD